MVKRNILIITAILAVIVAMTGIAAANPARIDIKPGDNSNPLYHPLGGATITYPVSINDMANTLVRRVEVYNTGLTTVTLYGDGMIPITVAAGGNAAINNWIPSSTAVIVSLDVTASSTGSVTILSCNYDSSITTCGSIPGVLQDFGAASNGFNIPEFPTVALPVAAVIGLVFFFQQRKEKR